MKRLLNYIFYLTIIVLSSSCLLQNDKTLLLSKAEKFLNNHPDSSLLILNNISTNNFSNRNLAKYSIVLSKALDKNSLFIKSDSIIKPAVEYYLKKGTSKEKEEVFYYLGRIYENKNDIETAINYFLSASRLTAGDTALSALIYASLARMYKLQYSFKDAISYYNRAINIYVSQRDTLNQIYNTYNKASCEQYLNIDSSITHFSEILALSDILRDTSMSITISRSIANISLYKEKNPTKAHTILISSIYKYETAISPSDYSLLSSIFISLNRLDTASFYATKAHSLIWSDDKYTKRNKVGILFLEQKIAEKQKDYPKALKISKQIINLRDSINTEDKQNLVQDLEAKYRTKQIQESYDNLKTKSSLLATISILLFLLLSITIYTVFSKRKQYIKKKNREIEEYRTQIEILQENFTSMECRYESISTTISELSQCSNPSTSEVIVRFQKSFEERLSEMKHMLEMSYIYSDNSKRFHMEIKKILNSNKGKVQKLFADTRDAINITNGMIADKLQSQYLLTDEEVNLSCLIGIGFTVQDISVIYGSSVGSIYNRRSKLITKYNLTDSEDNLDTFLKKIISPHTVI